MRIALDISPLSGEKFAQHRVRGTGFYTRNLKDLLKKYFPDNDYIYFSQKKPQETVDIVHYPYFEPFFFSLPFKKFAPTVVTIHDMIPLVFPNFFPPGIKGKLKWILQKKSLKTVSQIITDSMQSKADIIKFTGISSEVINVIYLSSGENFVLLNNKHLLNKTRKKYNLPEKFGLYVGDITWNKNLPRLIRAFKKTEIPLVMVGKALIETNYDRSNPWNQDRIEVQNLAESDQKIIRLGFVPDEDLVAIYNYATVFIMPSLYEGFGLPVLEAMNCGCPVITTEEGSLKEVAGSAAYFVNPNDIDNIAKGIVEVVGDKNLRKKMVENGFKQAKKFSWKKTVYETFGVYKKAAGLR